jgi:hypothetical protein
MLRVCEALTQLLLLLLGQLLVNCWSTAWLTAEEARQMLDVLKADPRAAQQFLLLAHMYARTDTYSLSWLRAALVKSK